MLNNKLTDNQMDRARDELKHRIKIGGLIVLIMTMGFVLGYIAAIKPVIYNEIHIEPGNYEFDIGDNMARMYYTDNNKTPVEPFAYVNYTKPLREGVWYE